MRSVLAVRRLPSRSRGYGGFSWQNRILVLVVFGACCLARPASAADSSPAQRAYEQGVEQFRAGNFEAACGLLADSYRLEPLPGVLFTWATCEVRADRVASAAQHYAEFLNAVSRLSAAERLAEDERREVAQRERARILPQVPYLTIVVSADTLRTSSVRRDGELLPANALGTEVPVDPGEHVIDFEGPDGSHAQQRIVLGKGEHKTIVVGFAGPRQPAPAKLPRNDVGPAPQQPGHTVTPWIYLAGGVGAAGILTGSVAGILALRDSGVVHDECSGRACSQRGKDAADAARLEATVSTIGLGVGLAGVVATTIVYLADSGSTPARVAAPKRWSVVAISPSVLGVGGAF